VLCLHGFAESGRSEEIEQAAKMSKKLWSRFLVHAQGWFEHPNPTGHNFSSVASYMTRSMGTSLESSKWALYISGVTLIRLKCKKSHVSILPVLQIMRVREKRLFPASAQLCAGGRGAWMYRYRTVCTGTVPIYSTGTTYGTTTVLWVGNAYCTYAHV